MRVKAIALALCLCMYTNVNAQDIQHDEITIKDNATKKRLLNTKTVDNVNNEFIIKNLGGSLSETLDKIPGLSSISIGSSQGKPVIRGLGFNRVAVIEDNIRHESQQWGSDHGLEIDQFSVLEAEVIKGPSSLEYGSDAIGGVLKINTLRVPKKETVSGNVNLTANTSNALLGASAEVLARKEKFFFTLRTTAQDYADYKVPTDYVNIYSYRVKLNDQRLRNTAGNELDFNASTGWIGNNSKLRFSISNAFTEGGMFANAHGLEPRRVDESAHDCSNRDIMMPSQKVNHLKTAVQYDKWWQSMTVNLNAAYQHNRREEYSQYTSHGYMPTVCPETLQNPDIEYLYDKDVFTVNTVANMPFQNFDLKAGANAEYQDNEIGGRSFIIPAFKSMTAGMFASTDYRLNNNTIVQFGLRYDIGNIHTEEYRDWFQSEGQYLQRASELNRNFNDFSFGCGITSRHGKFNYKLNIAKGFRMPIAKELAANGVNYHNFSYETGNANLNSETSYQADCQIDYLSKLWTITLSPFVGYFSNYIFLNPTPKFDRFYGNGNQIYNYEQCRVLRYGGEMEIKLLIDNRFVPFHNSKVEVTLNGDFVKSRQLNGNKKGYSLPFAPPSTIGFETVYTYHLKKTVIKTGFEEFFVGFDTKNAAKVTDIVPPENPTDGYFLLSTSAGCRAKIVGKDVMFSLKIKNLLNTVYFDHTSYYRLINVPGQGRCAVLSLTLKF